MVISEASPEYPSPKAPKPHPAYRLPTKDLESACFAPCERQGGKNGRGEAWSRFWERVFWSWNDAAKVLGVMYFFWAKKIYYTQVGGVVVVVAEVCGDPFLAVPEPCDCERGSPEPMMGSRFFSRQLWWFPWRNGILCKRSRFVYDTVWPPIFPQVQLSWTKKNTTFV